MLNTCSTLFRSNSIFYPAANSWGTWNFFVVSARSFTGLKSSRSSGCTYHFYHQLSLTGIITSLCELGDFQCWHATKPCHLTSVLRRYGVWLVLSRLDTEPGVTSQESVGYLVVICTTIFRCQLVSSGMSWSTRKAHRSFISLLCALYLKYQSRKRLSSDCCHSSWLSVWVSFRRRADPSSKTKAMGLGEYIVVTKLPPNQSGWFCR